MIYLLGNIVFGTAFVLIIKLAHVRGRDDPITIGAINYIVAAFIFLPEFLRSPWSDALYPALATGAALGVSYFHAYFLVSYIVRHHGAAVATVVSALSLLVPIVFAMFIWEEVPNAVQVLGIAAALLALSLMGGNRQKNKLPTRKQNENPGTTAQVTLSQTAWFGGLMLLLFFVLCGLARLSQEAFKHLCEPTHRPTFLVVAFTTAAIPSLVLLIARRRRIQPTEFGFGALMGIANVLQTYFMLSALRHLAGFIAFPVAGVGGLLLTAAIATGLLHETLNRKSRIAIGIASFALVLLNWKV